MDPAAITTYITKTFDGVDVVVASDNSFFFANLDDGAPPDHMLPFATLVTNDEEYDDGANLSRPGVYRLNIGVGKETFRSLFGASAGNDAPDLTALDRLMPHPDYGTMFWLCVLNPSPATFERVRPLLAEAYDRARERRARVRSSAAT